MILCIPIKAAAATKALVYWYLIPHDHTSTSKTDRLNVQQAKKRLQTIPGNTTLSGRVKHNKRVRYTQHTTQYAHMIIVVAVNCECVPSRSPDYDNTQTRQLHR